MMQVAKVKAKVRALSLSKDSDKVQITLDSDDFKQLSSLVVEVAKSDAPALGEEVLVTVERYSP